MNVVYPSNSISGLRLEISSVTTMAIECWLLIKTGYIDLTSAYGVSEFSVFISRNLFVNDLNSCEELVFFLLLVKLFEQIAKSISSNQCTWPYKAEYQMYSWATNCYQLFLKVSVGMLPINTTLGIIVALIWIFKQFLMQICISHYSQFLLLGGCCTRLLRRKPCILQSHHSCHLVCIS